MTWVFLFEPATVGTGLPFVVVVGSAALTRVRQRIYHIWMQVVIAFHVVIWKGLVRQCIIDFCVLIAMCNVVAMFVSSKMILANGSRGVVGEF